MDEDAHDRFDEFLAGERDTWEDNDPGSAGSIVTDAARRQVEEMRAEMGLAPLGEVSAPVDVPVEEQGSGLLLSLGEASEAPVPTGTVRQVVDRDVVRMAEALERRARNATLTD